MVGVLQMKVNSLGPARHIGLSNYVAITPGWSATLTLPDYGRVARHSGTIQRGPASRLRRALLLRVAEHTSTWTPVGIRIFTVEQ